MTQVFMYNESEVHIDGYQGILSFRDDEIKLQCKKRNLNIQGERLKIKSFNGIEIEICGYIHGVFWENM